jgi:hypothetical protein
MTTTIRTRADREDGCGSMHSELQSAQKRAKLPDGFRVPEVGLLAFFFFFSDIAWQTQKDMQAYFKKSLFGCMGYSLVIHCELVIWCLHRCAYCYADNYPGYIKRMDSKFMEPGLTYDQVRDVTWEQASMLMKKRSKLVGTAKVCFRNLAFADDYEG